MLPLTHESIGQVGSGLDRLMDEVGAGIAKMVKLRKGVKKLKITDTLQRVAALLPTDDAGHRVAISYALLLELASLLRLHNFYTTSRDFTSQNSTSLSRL